MEKTVNGHLDDENVTPANIRRLALAWLHKNKDWLLVIDDADDEALIATVFPSTPPLRSGHILLTSRVSTGWNNWYRNSRLLEVNLMSGRDSAIYLLQEEMSGNDGSVSVKNAEKQLEQMRRLNKEEYDALVWLGDVGGLHGLPLALRQASRYITEYKVTFSHYKRLYETCRLDIFKHAAKTDPLAAWLEANDLHQDYAPRLREVVRHNTLRLKSFTRDQLQERPISMEESDVVSFLRAQRDTDANFFALMLDPSRENFLTTWKLNYDKLCEDAATKEFILLCSCFASRIQIALLADGARYLGHGALRDFLKVQHCSGESRSGIEICQRVRELIEKLRKVSLATMVVGHHEEPHTDNELTRFGAFTVHHLVQQVVFLKFVTREDKIRSLNNAMRILEELRFLGKVNFELGRLTEAEECFEECLALYKKLYGENDTRIAFAMQGIGRVQQNNPTYMKDTIKRKEIETLLETLQIKREYFKYDNCSDNYSIAHGRYTEGLKEKA
ncbi:uncharacterized protein [Ptychodera flava]|uniref:uncharacterized protein n=1 Tax=Ptychodera flava TaxID=63121 RepID=UPI00396A48C8